MKNEIVRRPDFAGGGITEAERTAMSELSQKWIANAMRTDSVDADKLVPAIKALYAAAKLKEPRVIIVPSPRVMAFAYGFSAAILHSRKTGFMPALNATRAATDAATRAATYDATYAATRAATRAATYDATRAATRAATYDATYAATYAATDAATRAATYDATRAATRAATYDATYAATYDATRAATRAATYDATYAATDAATRAATSAATSDATYDATSDKDWAYKLALEIAGDNNGAMFMLRCAQRWYSSYQGGNMWSAWACYLAAGRDILGLKLPQHEAYAAWEQCAIEGGFRIMHEDFCMVSDRPCVLKVDEQNRPHCIDGPSHQWRDGWALYHVHGVQLSEEQRYIVCDPSQITVDKIEHEENAEIRRVMMEQYGYERYITDCDAKIVHSMPVDYHIVGLRDAKLLVKEVEDDEPIVFVDLLNSTPEPDGTVRRYLMRVDPNAYNGDASKNCQAAAASTWRDELNGAMTFKDWRDYNPIFES